MENAAGSFYAHFSTTSPLKPLIRELSETLLRTVSHIVMDADRPVMDADKLDLASNQSMLRRLPSANPRIDSMASGRHTTGRYLITTPQFERLWWDKGSEFRHPASIWRPIVPSGYAIVGDCLVRGYANFSFVCYILHSTKTAWMNSSYSEVIVFRFGEEVLSRRPMLLSLRFDLHPLFLYLCLVLSAKNARFCSGW